MLFISPTSPGFLTFSGGTEWEIRLKWVNVLGVFKVMNNDINQMFLC